MTDQERADAAEKETQEQATTEGDQIEGDEEDVVILAGEKEDDTPPAKEESSVIRHLRNMVRDKSKESRELREQLAVVKDDGPKLGPKPTLEGSGFDNAKYESALDKWYVDKADVDRRKQEREQAEAAKTKAWQDKLSAYQEKSKTLKVTDFKDVEEIVLGTFNVTQQGLLIDGTDNPAAVLYAVGKRPELLAELAAETNPVKFVKRLASLESTMTVTRRKPAAPPEGKAPEGSGGNKGKSELDKLREEAARTNDYSKVIAYKAKLRAEGK